jgi:N-acetylglucosamine-6-sulfatase
MASVAPGASGPAASTPPTAGRSEPPNIVFVLTDDQWLGSETRMPNVQRLLADHGVVFANAFVSTSLCCPSRASLYTGRYSHHTGVYDNTPPDGGLQAFDDRSTIATWLRAAGYRTSFVGRYLNGYEDLAERSFVPPGWDDWHGLAQVIDQSRYRLNENGRLVSYGPSPSDYLTKLLARKAVQFIRGARSPFFLHVATVAPHFPAIPAPEDAGSFATEPPYRPPSFNEADVSDKPWGSSIPPMDARKVTRYVDVFRRLTLESLQAVDRAVADIVKALRDRGLLDRTVIVFTSDNGHLFGEHRIVGKIWPYEESIRVPLIVRVPWASARRVETRLALNVDLPATFAELAGVRPGLPQDGLSLLPLLRNAPGVRWREEILIEYLGDAPALEPIRCPPYQGVRTERYKLVRYRNGWRELYDLARDPYELTNLAGRPEVRAVEQDLEARLARLTSS